MDVRDEPGNSLRLIDLILHVAETSAAVQVGNVAPLNVTQFFDGLVTIVDPAAFSDTSAKIRASVVGSVIAATGKFRAPAPAVGCTDRCVPTSMPQHTSWSRQPAPCHMPWVLTE